MQRFAGTMPFLVVMLAAASPCRGQSAEDPGTGSARAGRPPASAATVARLNIAVAQPLVVPGNVHENIRNMEPLVAEAARRQAQLVLFSECGITGYDLKGVGADAALSLEDPALNRVAAIARRHGVVLVAGLHEKRHDRLHNTAVVFFPEGRRVVQRKHLIMAAEKQVAPIVPAPRERTLFEVGGLQCAILICSDDGIPGIYEDLTAAGCDVVLLITAGAGSTELGFHQAELADPQRREKYLDLAVPCISRDGVDRCIKLNLAMAACNQAGWNPGSGYFHPGGSSITDRSGEVAAVIPPRFVFEHLRPDLAVAAVSATRKKSPGLINGKIGN